MKGNFKTQIIRVKRVSHTKAKGRVLNFQVVAIAGNQKGYFGWSIVKGSAVQNCKIKAQKKAISNVRKVVYDDKESTFLNDSILSRSKYHILLKRQRRGCGITASPLITNILVISGINNAVVSIRKGTNLVVLLQVITDYLCGVNTSGNLNSRSWFVLDR